MNAHKVTKSVIAKAIRSASNPPKRKLVIFDLDETLFSRYFQISEPILSHEATCSSRKKYYWINQPAWRVLMPEILAKHDVAIMTASICHSKQQIRDALNLGMFADSNNSATFDKAIFIDGNEFGDRKTLKGPKIIQLRNPNEHIAQFPEITSCFQRHSLSDMILVDDNLDHVNSANAVGINTVQAGQPNYLHKLADYLGLDPLSLPVYHSYELGWNPVERCVTMDNVSTDKYSLVAF